MPTEKRKMSTSPRESASGVASSTVWPPSCLPAERAEAKTRTFSKPCSREQAERDGADGAGAADDADAGVASHRG